MIFIDDESNVTRWHGVRAVHLMLGPACNMTCKHCSQTPVKNTYTYAPVGKGLSEEMRDFLITWGKDSLCPKILTFWGGEPLLYLSTIKTIVKLLEDNNAINMIFKVFTNGLLLTKEVADYFEEKDFYLVMSYDAPNPTAFRGAVPSDEAIAVFNAYKGDKRINSVFTSGNTDLIGCSNTIRKLFPHVDHSIAHFNQLEGSTSDTICFDFKDGEIRDAITRFSETKHGKWWIRSKNDRWFDMDEEAKRKILEDIEPCCHHGNDAFAIDFNGDCYACHNVGFKVGNVRDGLDGMKRIAKEFWQNRVPSACATCEIFPACRCMCPIAKKTEDGTEFTICKSLREMYLTCKELEEP